MRRSSGRSRPSHNRALALCLGTAILSCTAVVVYAESGARKTPGSRATSSDVIAIALSNDARNRLRRPVGAVSVDPETIRGLGRFTVSGPNDVHELVRATTQDRRDCLFDVVDGSAAATCSDPAGGLFTHRRTAVFVRFDGGPDPSTISRMYVAGMAVPPTRRVRLHDSLGTAHTVTVAPTGMFAIRVPQAQVRAGAVPDRIVALDDDDKIVESIRLPSYR